HEVRERDGDVDVARLDPGDVDEERRADLLAVDVVRVADVPVLPEGLAVIGVEDDHGGAPEVERALELEEPLDLDVDERDLLVVVRHPTLTEPGGEAVLEVGLVDVEEIGPEEIGPVDRKST